LKETASR